MRPTKPMIMMVCSRATHQAPADMCTEFSTKGRLLENVFGSCAFDCRGDVIWRGSSPNRYSSKLIVSFLSIVIETVRTRTLNT